MARLSPAQALRLRSRLKSGSAAIAAKPPKQNTRGIPRDFGAVLDAQCQQAGLPVGVAELMFHDERDWRFDRAWPDLALAVEIEGGIYSGGRHTRGYGYEQDLVKYAEATVQGWRLLRVSTGQVSNGRALGWLRAMMALPANPCAPLQDRRERRKERARANKSASDATSQKPLPL